MTHKKIQFIHIKCSSKTSNSWPGLADSFVWLRYAREGRSFLTFPSTFALLICAVSLLTSIISVWGNYRSILHLSTLVTYVLVTVIVASLMTHLSTRYLHNDAVWSICDSLFALEIKFPDVVYHDTITNVLQDSYKTNEHCVLFICFLNHIETDLDIRYSEHLLK